MGVHLQNISGPTVLYSSIKWLESPKISNFYKSFCATFQLWLNEFLNNSPIYSPFVWNLSFSDEILAKICSTLSPLWSILEMNYERIPPPSCLAHLVSLAKSAPSVVGLLLMFLFHQFQLILITLDPYSQKCLKKIISLHIWGGDWDHNERNPSPSIQLQPQAKESKLLFAMASSN